MEFTDQYNRPIDRKKPPTIVYAKTRSIKICIHNYAGCGRQWFLSAHELGFNNKELNTEDFEEALETAKKEVETRFIKIKKDIENFLEKEIKP